MIRARAARLGHALHALDATESTQLVLAGLAEAGAPEGTVVTARHQTGGRGRRGHAWWDAPGESLLCSVLLRPLGPVERAPQLSLVAGLAVAEGLDAAGVTADIKWPNDVLIAGGKVAGVLAEAASAADGAVRHVLVGIGVNVDQVQFPEPLRDIATSLRRATGRPHDVDAVRAAVFERLSERYAEWLDGGFPAVRDAWRRRATTLGRAVRIAGGGEGIAVDVAEDGALLVRLGSGAIARLVTPPTAGGA